MAGRGTAAGLALAAVALIAAGCGVGTTTTTVTVTRTHTVTTTRTVTKPATTTAAPCAGSQLSGTFAVVSGSAGAGQISYLLTLKNTSQTRCYVSGIPNAVLLGSSGASLPTHIAAGTGGGAKVTLAPGASAKATARFSPTVAGTGDSTTGPCQPKAQTLQVTPNGGGTTAVPIQPPTSVCEEGTLNFGAYG